MKLVSLLKKKGEPTNTKKPIQKTEGAKRRRSDSKNRFKKPIQKTEGAKRRRSEA